MIVPEYWAEAKTTRRDADRQVTIQRFGWSDESEAAALSHAEERIANAFSQLDSGEKPERREPKVPYNGAEGVPIREEIVHRHDDVIVTRNSYGALCLNTPDVLFADVDFETGPGTLTYLLSLAVLLSTATCYGLMPESSWLLYLFIVLVVLFVPLSSLIFKIQTSVTGGAKNRAMNRITDYSAKHPDWHLRVYSTPAGLRVLVMHSTFDPTALETFDFFGALKTDPIYVRMCERQNCFRARVSPKPWRVGYGAHLKPRPGVWPINPAKLTHRVRWIEGYEKASIGFASCQFLEKLGSDTVDPKADHVRLLHDDYCKANEDLALA